jgi:signal peptidase I
MTEDDWWAQAVDQFGLETGPEPIATDSTVLTAQEIAPTVPTPRRRRRRPGVDWVVLAIASLAAAFLLRTFVIQQFAVDGESMLGTLHSGDRVLVNKLSYKLHDPRHGDVVVLKDFKESLEERDLIKRIIGLPGETVEYRDCELYIDGSKTAEPYLDASLVDADHCGESQDPVEVEAGHVFVMGDNRAGSLDSRTIAIGQIPYDHLIGRAFVVVWPTADWAWL